MTAGGAEHQERPGHRGAPLSVDEVARAQGVQPKTVDDLACDEVFESEEALAEFLQFVRDQRNANLV
ncbi:hypothetical protein B0I33_11317 [Prauserella shujinwangii]|uniref:Uncharacterized protein n=1 Tax=Prauserella shujinwangii TaxID=1453103 RepID=A0A2T0LLD8_9PSEU|nr:hypothetical protein B0I33_11317 [Prauserella shujinwangii]